MDGKAGLESGDLLEDGAQGYASELWGGEMCELLVGLEEAVERRRPLFDDGEPAAEVAGGFMILKIQGRTELGKASAEAAGDGFNGRERVVDLMAEYPDDPLPGDPFLFTQRGGDVGQDEQGVGDSV